MNTQGKSIEQATAPAEHGDHFTCSDWEHELDLMVNPSRQDLEQHLGAAPKQGTAFVSENAAWLNGFLKRQAS